MSRHETGGSMAAKYEIRLNTDSVRPATEEIAGYLEHGALPVEVAQRLADAVELLLSRSQFFVSKDNGLPAARAGGLFIDLEPSKPLCELLAAVRAGDFDFLAVCERHGLVPSLKDDVCGSSKHSIEESPFLCGGGE